MSKSLSCPPELWPIFSRLLDKALELPSREERLAWVERLGAEHATLKPVLVAAIEAAAVPAAPLEQLRKLGPATAFRRDQEVGPYRLVDLLGQGGMGEVWRAQRTDAGLNREVALKLPHAWMMGRKMQQRLSLERDILAALSHPNIAQIYDAGVTDDQQPWLALELVIGRPIRDYCQERRLNLKQRLQLFGQVIEAVRAAHARLIVHRDLKPGNILVTSDGKVKLLDFGIAKLIRARGTTAEAEVTRVEHRLATLEYAAPEQLTGGEVTVATDIYSLGVILFELVCGARPHDRRAQRTPTDAEAAPVLASTRISEAQAGVLGAPLQKLQKRLRGDIDAILVKALDPRPERRYLSAEQFGDDLVRHLELQPIRARQMQHTERALRFVRANRLAAGLSGLVALSLVLGIAGVAWQAHRASLAAELARTEAARANAVSDFMVEILAGDDREMARDGGGNASARDMLNLAVQRADVEMAAHPEVQLELYEVAEKIYAQWGDLPRYYEVNSRRIKAAERAYGPTHADVIDALLSETEMRLLAEELPAAKRLLERAEGLIRDGGHELSALRALWLLNRVNLDSREQGPREPRLQMLHDALKLYEDYAPDQKAGMAEVLYFMAAEHYDADDVVAAERESRQAASLLERAKGKDRNDRLLSDIYGNLGVFQRALGDAATAEKTLRHALDLQLKTYGRDDSTYWTSLALLAQLMHWRGDWQQADAMYKQALIDIRTVSQTLLGPSLPLLRLLYGGALVAEGRPAHAIEVLEPAVAEGVNDTSGLLGLMDVQLALGNAYAAAGRATDARRLFEAALPEFLKNPEGRVALDARQQWGRFLLQQNDLDAAGREFAAVVAGGQRGGVALAQARSGQALLALRRGDAPGALSLSTAALADLDAVTPVYDLRIRHQLWRDHASILDAAGQHAQAREFRNKAAAASRKSDPPGSLTNRT